MTKSPRIEARAANLTATHLQVQSETASITLHCVHDQAHDQTLIWLHQSTHTVCTIRLMTKHWSGCINQLTLCARSDSWLNTDLAASINSQLCARSGSWPNTELAASINSQLCARSGSWPNTYSWPEPYTYTVFYCIFVDSPAKNTVYTPYIYIYILF